MVGHSAIVTAVRDPTSIRSNARHRRGLATFAGWSFVDVVVAGHFTARAPVASRDPRHDEPGKEIESHREDSGPHGAEAVDGCPGAIGRNDHFFQHMPGRRWYHGDDGIRHSAVLKRRIRFLRDELFKPLTSWRTGGIQLLFDVQSTCEVGYRRLPLFTRYLISGSGSEGIHSSRSVGFPVCVYFQSFFLYLIPLIAF